MFTLLKTEGRARTAQLTCAHGTAQTPVFMNVGTQGAIKGAVSAQDLREIGCQIELSNTYHLHLRPGDELVKEMGGLHRFMRWDGPILTDSGGFKSFLCPGGGRFRRKGSPLPPTLMGAVSLWGRRRVYRFNGTWVRTLPWRLMSVWRILRPMRM